jgi:Mn-dependent DtxR family transcriptional regulator
MEFLRAMAEDDGPSTSGDIGRRLGAKTNLVANYRARLLAAGLIEPAGHGKVDFAIPGLRRSLRSNPG